MQFRLLVYQRGYIVDDGLVDQDLCVWTGCHGKYMAEPKGGLVRLRKAPYIFDGGLSLIQIQAPVDQVRPIPLGIPVGKSLSQGVSALDVPEPAKDVVNVGQLAVQIEPNQLIGNVIEHV